LEGTRSCITSEFKENEAEKQDIREATAMIYKRGCNKKGPNGSCSKCGERGACGVYWYKFMWLGRLVRESTKQGNDKVARQMEAAHRTSLAKGEVGLRDKKAAPTLREFIDNRFEPWARATFGASSPKTWRDFYKVGTRAIKKYKEIANLRVDEITSERAAEFGAYRQSEGCKISTVNSSLRVLRRILGLAVEWGLIESAPKIKKLPGERHREHVVTPEEEAKYLAAAAEPLGSVAAVLVDTGMRPEECFRLRWDSLTWSNGRYGTLLVTHGKTAAARRLLPMTLRVRRILEARWESAGKPAEGLVWPAPTRSGHLEPSSIKKQHAKALAASQVRPFVLYSLRHTFLTRLGESGCDAWTLAKIAGHSSIAISAQYVHPSDAVLAAIDRLGGHKIGHTDERADLPKASEKLLLA
jgi:integrase